MRILRDLLHVTEKVTDNMAILIGNDFNEFRKYANGIERRFIYLDEIRSGHYSVKAFCPNCTISWPRTAMTSDSLNSNVFDVCCEPLRGKNLKVLFNGFIPMVYRHRKRKCSPRVTGVAIDATNVIGQHLGFKARYCFGGYDTDVFGVKVGLQTKVS